jgi:histone deacetylase complex regulatory component SIN3
MERAEEESVGPKSISAYSSWYADPVPQDREHTGAADERLQGARGYLEKVERHFETQPHVNKSFLDIMLEFKSKDIDRETVIERVGELFADHLDLLSDFEQFLPTRLQQITPEEPTPAASPPVLPSVVATQSTRVALPSDRIAVTFGPLPPPTLQLAPSSPPPPNVEIEVAMMEEETGAEQVQPHDYRPQPFAAALLPRPPSPARTMAERKQVAKQHSLDRRKSETSPTKTWCNMCVQV